MAASTAKHLIKTLFNCRGSYRLENVRYATGLRKSKRLGKVPELARTFEQRLAGIEKKGGFLYFEFPLTTFYLMKIKYISFTFKMIILLIRKVAVSSSINE